MNIAEVYLNQTNKRIDRPYDYLIPEPLVPRVVPGVRVAVGFGRGERQLEGFVVRLKTDTDYPEGIKAVAAVIDDTPILTPAQIELCLFMKRHYCSLFYEALGCFAGPVRVQKKRRPADGKTVFEAYAVTEKAYRLKRREALRGSLQRQVIARLSERDCSRSELMAIGGDIGATLRKLERRGIIEGYLRENCSQEGASGSPNLQTPPQKGGALYREYLARDKKNMPVFAATADFETRAGFYIRLIQNTLAAGKDALLLFPEISLSLELEQTLRGYFGNMAAVCHGRQSQRERYSVFRRVLQGEVRVVIGSRAALFLPLGQPGLIIVDEEQDASYHAVAMPKYSTLVLAQKYAELTGARLVTGDEIPSVTAALAVEQGKWLSVGDLHAPLFKAPAAVDLQQEMKSGNYDFLSRALRQKLEDCLNRSGRAALLLNKRGYADYVFCRNCGYVEKCPTCQVALRPYKGVLRCHYCGYIKPQTQVCPQCGAPSLKALGLGLDQVSEVLKKRYPEASILKIDGGSVQSYADFREIQKLLETGAADIVLGTRMLVRFPNLGQIDLGAALLADSDLNRGDYRSSEEAWQLYGKFFRRVQGEGILQTYDPENTVVKALVQGDAAGFYEKETDYRRLLGYPPFRHLVLIALFHAEEAVAAAEAQTLCGHLRASAEAVDARVFQIFDPFLSGVVRKTGQTRWKIMVKAQNLEAFYAIMDKVIDEGGIENLASKVSIDIDPPTTL